MKYISTNGNGTKVSFREAVIGNLPTDGGLYFPEQIPKLSEDFLESVPSLELHEIASHALYPFCKEGIDRSTLEEITRKVFHFPIPLVKVAEGIHCLELFHGPTYAFKDVGAKFLAECLAHFNTSNKQETTVLVATSGDTGGAVANGFLGVDGVRVIILYPSGKVSDLQEKQLTTLGQNITALEVEGSFDDCQNLVKQAFSDRELNKLARLSSANSINLARWLPQSIYYYVPLQHGMKDHVVSVPSGNYGNLTAGVLAMQMGVPIKRFIAASNANDTVPRYLKSREYEPKSTVATIANAMDVADPSNFRRLQALFGGDIKRVREALSPYTLNDQQIKETIRKCRDVNDYLLDPHSAIGYEALCTDGDDGVFLGTAHYCKFLPTMNEALEEELPVPAYASHLAALTKKSIKMPMDYEQLREIIVAN